MENATCFECVQEFTPKNSRQRFCTDKCRYKEKDRRRSVICSVCGGPVQRSGKSNAGITAHMSCRGQEHGSPGMYRSGCRCVPCRNGQSERMNDWIGKFKATHGIHPSTYYRREFKKLNGFWPTGDWISRETRVQIYERDDWTCQICGDLVDVLVDFNHRLAPTLVHIIPRSLVLVPDHSESNLRTAHRWCNSQRGNRI